MDPALASLVTLGAIGFGLGLPVFGQSGVPLGLDTSLTPLLEIRGAGEYSQETKTLRERMAEANVPGLSVAVMVDGEIVWAGGFGVADIATGRPVTDRTLFQAASISKPAAAVAAAHLAETDVVDLDADVDSMLTSWTVPPYDGDARVTLRRLLSHAAGTNVHGFPGYAVTDEIPSAVGVLDGRGNTSEVRVETPPGSTHRYSGGGYTIAQVAMVDASEEFETFPSLMRAVVLDPLGMNDSTFEQPLPDALHDRAATAYQSDGSPYPGKWHVYPEMAAAGLWTTPSDLARLFGSLQRCFAGEDGPVLSADAAREMLEQPLETPYGLGLSLGKERFGHGGGNAGFRCAATFFFEGGNGAVVMSNSDNGWPVNADVMRTVFTHYGWAGLGPFERTVVPQSKDELARFEGVYEIEGYGRFRVVIDEQGLGLSVTLPDGERFSLLPEAETTFFDPADGVPITFVIGDDGRATRAEWSGSMAQRVGE